MPVFGVICEYDPFHLGHRWMLEQLHRQGPVVCAMSGCFTQRGEFAAVNKFARAEMAVRNGADLVLELPTPWAVSGAERFARRAMRCWNTPGSGGTDARTGTTSPSAQTAPSIAISRKCAGRCAP